MADTRLPILYPNRREGRLPEAKASRPAMVSRFPGAQQAFILEQGADRSPVAGIGNKVPISQAPCCNRTKTYDGMQPSDMRRLEPFQDKVPKLRKRVADFSLDRNIRQDVIRRKV